jgi:hypothetical protein
MLNTKTCCGIQLQEVLTITSTSYKICLMSDEQSIGKCANFLETAAITRLIISF